MKQVLTRNYYLFIPAFYFFKSRLNTFQSLVFHAWYEWLAGILILIFFLGNGILDSVIAYIGAFLVFITLYETGYIVNDYYSVKKENSPRHRIPGLTEVEEIWVILALIWRFGLFMLLSFFFGLASGLWIFYALLLILIFSVHNFLPSTQLKFITFTGLALLRFSMPLVPFLSLGELQIVLPAVLINYVFYRLINYLDSKDLLNLTERKLPRFKISFYALLLPVNLIFYIAFESGVFIALNIYYLVFWLIYFIREWPFR